MRRLEAQSVEADAVLALVVAGLLVIQVAAGDVAGGVAAASGAAALLGAAVFVRRRHPVFSTVAVFAVIVAASLLGVGSQGLYGAMLAAVAVIFGLAYRVSLRGALLGVAYGLAMIFWSVGDAGIWRFLFAPLLLGGACLAGRAAHRYRALVNELTEAMAQLQANGEQLVAAAIAEEKVEIARELHDIVAHAVSVMVIQAGAAAEVLDLEPERSRQALRSVEESGRQALGELRRLLEVLRPDASPRTRAPTPGIASLDEIAETVRDAGIDVELDVAPNGYGLPPGIDLSAYRIIQEALTNVLKHSDAKTVSVTVRADGRTVELDVVDNGRSTDRRIPVGGGHGVVGMRERAVAYGGSLEIGPRTEGGFRVHARLRIPSE